MPTQAEPPPHVCWLDQRKHLPHVLELDAAASADRRRIYDGVAWTCAGFREYLKAGSGMVALNAHKSVVGFAVYTLRDTMVQVSKLIAPTRAAEHALLAALWQTLKNNNKSFLDLPLVLDLG